MQDTLANIGNCFKRVADDYSIVSGEQSFKYAIHEKTWKIRIVSMEFPGYFWDWFLCHYHDDIRQYHKKEKYSRPFGDESDLKQRTKDEMLSFEI